MAAGRSDYIVHTLHTHSKQPTAAPTLQHKRNIQQHRSHLSRITIQHTAIMNSIHTGPRQRAAVTDRGGDMS